MLQQRNGAIRNARLSDIPRLLELEKLCWSEDLRVSEQVIRQRIFAHPVGQFVVESEDGIGGVVYSQRIRSADDLLSVRFDTADRLHRPDGAIAHVLSLNIEPGKQSFGFGDMLLEHLLTWCHGNGVAATAVGVTRCRDFERHPEFELQQYIRETNAQGRCLDTVLRMHQLHGAEIRHLVPGYRPGDVVNDGHGVLVAYDLPRRQERVRRLAADAADVPVTIPAVDQLTSDMLCFIDEILGGGGEREGIDRPLESPLFELGFDSASLLDLQDKVQTRYGIQLESLFFFERNTGARIISYLDGVRAAEPIPSPHTPPTGTDPIAAPGTATDPGAPAGAVAEGRNDPRDIAIIGMACRLPDGIEDRTALWRLLEEGGCAVGTLPEGRWRWPDGFGPETHPGIDRGGFVADAGCFEAGLFRITPYEAQRMDPQQRWMLELAWACLEDAGYPASAVAGAPMGVFVGASGSDYQRVMDTARLPVRANSGLATSMAIIANRVSYFYDLRGPSVQLDTACSSSLVAVHTAVRALRAGECETALVGGVNVLCHPAGTLAYRQAGMLSPDGLCKTFDESANGYVRSEGGVVLLLKPLAAALAEGDHVHAVIKGSATNHGGQAGGLTVPSAAMQASLVEAALADAGVAASDISYIEAHGTGTSLGDPIEVQGLARAFAGSDAPCAIGSVKTNLGHLEAAAGIAGLMKTVLSMRHGKLPALAHYTRRNPQITLDGTPFTIAERLSDWDLGGRPTRLAGVSSFGSGGSNAHVIVAEPPVAAPRATAAEEGEPGAAQAPRPMVVLSAESEPQLVRQAERLLNHLRLERPADADLVDLAYTTQVGREALSERLGLLPTSVASLESLLEAVVSDVAAADAPSGGSSPAVLRGRAKGNSGPVPAVGPAGDSAELLAAWVQGATVDWGRLYEGAAPPRRVPLPTHAFARSHYWLDAEAAVDAPKGDRRHPLLQRESAAHGTDGVTFGSTFTARDFFLRDHRVGGERVLPAVAYLEMAREAMDRTLPTPGDGGTVLCLENVVWSRPLVVGDADRTVHTALTGGADRAESADGRVSYEIRTGPLSETSHVVHSRGVGSRRPAVALPLLEIEALKSRMNGVVLDVQEYYEALRAAGLEYGESHRALREIRLGDRELLASLALPDSVAGTRGDYVLHPSVLDGALQAAFAPEAHAAGGAWSAPLPFALDRLEVVAPTPVRAYAWIREVPGGSSGQVRRWDLDLCDEQGEIFAILRGYSVRKTTEPAEVAATGVVTLFRPVWRGQPVQDRAVAPGGDPVHTARLVLACGFDDRLAELRALAPHMTFLEPPEEGGSAASVSAAVAEHAVELLRAVKGLLLGRPTGSVLLQVLTPSGGESAMYQALSGLLRTAQLENPVLVGQIVAVPAGSSVSYVAKKLDEDGRWPQDRRISHAGGVRRVLGWEPFADADADAEAGAELHAGEPVGAPEGRSVRWRDNGVYLITGGAGGLGLIFAQEIARRAKHAVVCLTGRSSLDPAKKAALAALRAAGAKAEYHVLDASDEHATGRLVAELQRHHGALNGVIHAAGVVHDNFLAKKPVAEFRRVLAPKLDGCRNLDEATKDTELDFFVLFSSIMGATGNVGQGDYAVANAFLDEFAHHRGALVDAGARSGRTVAIGWPLWQNGGMGADPATRRALRVRSGLLPMTTEAGVVAFHRALDSGEPHVIVGAGEETRLRALLHPGENQGGADEAAPHSVVPSASDGRAFVARTVRFLKEEFSRLTHLPVSGIDDEEPLGSYGMDSILATELTAGLETTFGSLSKTLLFEYHTLAELGTYFVAGHRGALEALFAQSRTAAPAADATASVAAPPVAATPAVPGAGTGGGPARPATTPASSALDIAIIGLSGRYPESRDLREYWQNLSDGRDCVVEVPEDRWDWRAYYSEDRTRPGRHYSKWGGFIAEVDRFDPLFFNISPHEADYLDPQERLFLEHAWTAMEDAGYTRERLRRTDDASGDGLVGVYAGVMWGQYQLLFPGGDANGGNPSAIGSSYASVANRVSFVMNLHGPSMTVDTMCSSSLTAVELACRDLRQGRTRLAFAGGVNVTVHPNKYLALSTGQFISSKGHCESFGIGGDGYIPGEGVGVVLLKPLHDAERDGDHIYGVIKGSGMSHGGRTNGYTVPNPRAQQAAVRGALSEAGVDPRAISYVEAHGTGTKLGDPIEITGLSQAFRAGAGEGGGGDSQYCHLGSAKSNIGHCESAAGIAGLTKVLLQFKHGQIAPSLHSATLNPSIDFAGTPFVVNQELRDWERPVVDGRTQPRIAGISSFGAGGSNAHLVVAEHEDRRPAPAGAARTPLLFPLSAKNDERLLAYAGELLRFAREADAAPGKTHPADLAYTLQTGREAMDERLGVIADSFAELAEKLERHLAGDDFVDGLHRGNAKRGKEALSLIPAEELAATVGKLVERGKLTGLLDLWVRGAAPDWSGLHVRTTPAPRMISAPTYPFARERHWIPETKTRTAPAPRPGAETAAGTGSRAALYLTKQWRETPPGAARTRHTTVAVLHDRATRRLAEALSELFDDATLLEAAPGAETVLAQHIGKCSAWIDLTGAGAAGSDGSDVMGGLGVSGRTLELLQSALAAKASRDIRLLYVTQGLETPDASAGERVNLTGAARAALHRLLQSEYRGLTSCHVDLDPAVRDVAELAAFIHRELSDDGGEAEVCYRAGVRRTPVLAEAAPGPARTAPPAFADDEVLLVTGGTRGLGLLCAQHLVEEYGVRRLVLTGRESFPPRRLWGDPDTCPPSVREKIDAVLALEAKGVEVRVLALPLDRADQVASGIATIEATLGRVVGVIHAAGLVDTRNPAFVRKSVPDIARVLSPKVDGTRNLLAALDARALRFAVLFSSVSAVVPTLGVGQSDYAMGNAFMDYFAQAHARYLPITSVQWPSWQEAGFGEVKNQAYTDSGLLSITNAEGLAFLDEVLTGRRGPVVMPVRVDSRNFDPGALLSARPAGPAPRIATPATAIPVTSAPAAAPPESAGGVSLRARLADFLSSTFEGQLGLKTGQLDESISYADYGADSILLAQVLQQIRQRLGIELDPSALLEYPTLSELAAWLLNTYESEIAAQFGEDRTAHVGESRSDSHPVRHAVPTAQAEPTVDSDTGRDSAVAVIGMACRLPGAPDVGAYWDLLAQGRSAIREVPESRWGRPTGFHAGLIDDVSGFDAGYFMLHDEDVRAMDPQALVLLEESLKATHHAGYRLGELDGTRTGVYVGARSRNRADDDLVSEARNPIMAVGQNYLASNVSQFFNWHGPAMVMDTACSSSLVAMKVATDALAAGSVDLALVGGVSLLADTSPHDLFRRRGLLREDGEFHIFDGRAGGVVLGEGAGVVVLKSLARAERDGDTVYAVIEGVAVNNDGRTAGPATPNLAAQKQVMREALRQADCAPSQIGYLDVNGSGSEMTDLLELKAIEAVYCEDRGAPLRLGSMKPNIGHPLCAEGIAAFIKVVLMLHHQRMVPFLSGTEPMEHYTIDPARLDFPRHADATDLPYAALSSFADGGTNGHVVLGHRAPRPGRPRRGPVEPPELSRRDVRTGERARTAQPLVWTRRISGRDAVLDGHRVYGRRLLPGLAWIDLLYGCFAEPAAGASYDELILRGLSIYRPLAVDDDGVVEIRIEARAETPDSWRITVTDAAPDRSAQGSDEDQGPYITAEMHRAGDAVAYDARVPAEVLDALRASDERTRDLEEVYRSFRAQELVHSGLMKAVGAACTVSDDIWLRVAVDEHAASGDREERLFHPALIDGSAVAASAAALSGAMTGGTPADGERGLFLPLFYGSFRAGAPLGRACYTRVRRDSVELRGELLTFTMEFFDPAGRKIGELADLTTKLVRDAGHIDPERRADAPAAKPAAVGPLPESGPVGPGYVEMAAVVTSVVAARLGVPADQVGAGASYYGLGLDSATLLGLAGEIGDRLGAKLSPTLLFEHPSVAELAAHLARHHRPVEPAVSVAAPAKPAGPAARVVERPAAPVREPAHDDIAIVGIGGKYPKAGSVAEFWENLKSGRDCVTEVPESRWPRDTFRGERTPSGRKMSAWGGFIDDVDCFDAEFFGIPAAEAALLDPQERLFLEVCWEAVEDAGYTPAGLTGTGEAGPRRAVGVFAGVMHKDYVLVQHDAASGGDGGGPLSLNAAAIPNRVSHFCDFRGPSMAVDTVCASSLSAVHLAVESLRRGECLAALAGGVNLSLHPGKYRTYGALELLASDAPARSFGAGGDGYVSAEGVGAVLLKPLSRALADGDAVYAVIKGSAVNHSGRTPGIRVPSVAAQADLIEDCLDRAGVDPRSLGYLEAHATGTEIGDLIEVQGLRRAFERRTDAKGFCALGSVKSAIGHAEAAAGISGLTKAVLQLHHKTLTPLVAGERTNPYLDLDDSPFRLQTELEEWTVDGAAPRRAGVSAFGATGVNAHVVLEEAPSAPGVTGNGMRDGAPPPVLIPLSATNSEHLRAYAAKLLRFLETKEGVGADPSELAHTLQTGRVALAERAVILGYGLDDVKLALDALARGTASDADNVWRGRVTEQPLESRLLDEDDLRAELVGRWLAQGKWGKIAELWLGGYALDWRVLHGEAAPRRLHLPTYPFARQRHWVAASPHGGAAPARERHVMNGAGEMTPPAISAPANGAPVNGAPASGGSVRWALVPDGETAQARPDTAHPALSPEEKARGFLRQLVAERLGRPAGEIGLHAGLIDLGLTSLGAVGLTRDLVATVDPGFVPSILFEYGTIAELAACLAVRRPAELARLVATRTEEQPRPQRAEGPHPEVLAVLERLRTGTLHLDDAIALLDTERHEK
ncbi:SDR family NAD(P)-dependent oxidoreductase [Streptomyces sp. H27-C3]|uniref:SDR family NAD(P)-dependent oxidoreductase n=1 Tax=Streptomyces sp. H27-C3 TaxID=3046305 RepID=UPI0024B9D4B5|nr:SDR family NAD(P)-dependent oxidoreductase [Streptomyces sp. H27-C3]MDJ0460315.1 SDR family NAD(P)-dependent oxidoreductase [Streptomyces sp. H27-C3]